MSKNIYEPDEVPYRYCIFHELPLPCPICIGEQRAFMAIWQKLAATPGAIITSFDQSTGPGYWVKLRYRVEEDGSRTLLSEQRWIPGEDEPQC